MTEQTRPTLDLDGDWRFVPDPEQLHRETDLPEGEPIRVPGCWEAQVSRPYRIITGWYRRTFDVPADWEGDRVLLRFGAVMYQCWVWLNGRRVGDHEGGYTPFTLEVQDAVRWGEENTLAVEVVNPLNALSEFPSLKVETLLLAEQFETEIPLSQAPHGKQTWYTSTSGITQSVRVERVPRTYLASVHAAPDVPGGTARLRWSCSGDIRGGADSDRSGAAGADSARFRVLAPDGTEVATRSVALADECDGTIEVPIPDPVLWGVDRPNLYRVEATLVRGEEEVDRLETRFGMRHVTTRDGKIILNGEPLYMLGALDQDFYPDTIVNPPSREFLVDQFRKAREMGINLLRVHIKVPDPAYLDAADEAGLLLWCELPNWSTFTLRAAARGRSTLRAMVDEMGDHPSIIIWTIINEDWGTKLRYEARDRQWLHQMYRWLKELDPTRLVVDNSPCNTPETPNFHVETDLADFHMYYAMPDNAIRWRNAMADFARRPAWLWSPHGDAVIRGDEPLILSEFGNWGLPRLDRLVKHYGREPWWFLTGQGYYRPAGMKRRFHQLALDRIVPTVDHLAEATQWNQFEALQYQIHQMRRHRSIQGYVITEFTDAYWEANGLLDIARGTKVYHERLRELNAPDIVIPDLEQRDYRGGDRLCTEVLLSSFGEATDGAGHLEWQVDLDDGQQVSGEVPIPEWPHADVVRLGDLEIDLPDVDRSMIGRLTLRAIDSRGTDRATTEMQLAMVPRALPGADRLRIAVHDPLDIWSMAERITELGHELAPPDAADVIFASQLTEEILQRANAGAHVLATIRTRESLPERLDLARRISVHFRNLPHTGWPGQVSPWEGDWVSSFNWIAPDALPGLPPTPILDFAYRTVLPDHVLLGYDPGRHRNEVASGVFVGWVHAPAAIVWRFPQGSGSMTLTTFRLAPERGPVADVLLERLLQHAGGRAASGRARSEAPVLSGV